MDEALKLLTPHFPTLGAVFILGWILISKLERIDILLARYEERLKDLRDRMQRIEANSASPYKPYGSR
jgi:hypothetical protein